jgi:uncharacterized phage-associated protein
MTKPAVAVAQAFLDLAAAEGISLTNMHLQKLVYFAHGVYLAAFDGSPLIADEVKAWDFGPVIPPLYERLRAYGRGVVPTNLAPETRGSILPDRPEGQAILSTWYSYKRHSGWDLSVISHAPGSPWDVVWNQQQNRYGVIPDAVTRYYYANRVKHTNG